MCAVERVVRRRREPAVCVPSLFGREILIERGGKQRVCETRAAVFALDHAGGERRLEGLPRDAQRFQSCVGRVPEGRA